MSGPEDQQRVLFDFRGRSERAQEMGVAQQALSEVRALREQTMSREEIDTWRGELRDVRDRDRRWMRRLIVTTVVAVAMAAVGGWWSLSRQASERERVARELIRVVELANASCQARNASLVQQELVYEDFIAIEQLDVEQGSELAAEKIRAYERAIASLPDPVDCTRFTPEITQVNLVGG